MSVVAPPRSLLGIDGLSAGEFDAVLDLAALMKRHPLAWRSSLDGRAVACLFDAPSTRDHVSLEVAVHRLGAHPVVLSRLGTVAATAGLLSSYCDLVALRTDHHRDLLELAEHAAVPVVNAGTDREDPCRALADCLTLRERFGALSGLELAYVGACGPVAHSLIEAAMLARVTVRLAAPPERLPDPALLARAGSAVQVCETPREAVAGALAVYAAEPRPELLSLAAPGALILRANELAANLLPVEQAVLHALATGDWEL